MYQMDNKNQFYFVKRYTYWAAEKVVHVHDSFVN